MSRYSASRAKIRDISKLTPLEDKIFELKKIGKTNQQIADELGLQLVTIQRRNATISEKLGHKEPIIKPITSVVSEKPSFPPLPKTQFPPMTEEMKRIMKEVSEKHKILITDMFSPSRESRLVHARRDYVFRCRSELKNASFPRIGRSLNQDHTTVLYSYQIASKDSWRREPFVPTPYSRYGKINFALTPLQKVIKEMLDDGATIGQIAKEFSKTSKQISGQKAEIKRKLAAQEKTNGVKNDNS